jgi:hypothetical protein
VKATATSPANWSITGFNGKPDGFDGINLARNDGRNCYFNDDVIRTVTGAVGKGMRFSSAPPEPVCGSGQAGRRLRWPRRETRMGTPRRAWPPAGRRPRPHRPSNTPRWWRRPLPKDAPVYSLHRLLVSWPSHTPHESRPARGPCR